MKNRHQIGTDNVDRKEETPSEVSSQDLTPPDSSDFTDSKESYAMEDRLSSKAFSPEMDEETVNAVSHGSTFKTRPRWRLMIAGLAAFIAWGIALTIVWREVRLGTTIQPSAMTESVLRTLEKEAFELRKMAQGQTSATLPNEFIPTSWIPENDFSQEDREYLQNALDGRRMPGVTEVPATTELPISAEVLPDDLPGHLPSTDSTSQDLAATDSAVSETTNEATEGTKITDKTTETTNEADNVEALPGMPEDVVSEKTTENIASGSTGNATVVSETASPSAVTANHRENTENTDTKNVAEEELPITNVSVTDGLILQYHLETNQELTRVLQQSHDTPELLLITANYFRLFGRYSEALQIGRQYINEIPSNVETTNPSSGKSKISSDAKFSKKPQKVETSPNTSISSETVVRMQSQGWLFLAEVALEANQASDAIGLFEKAFALSKPGDSALYSLATAQYRAGQYEVSIETLQTLLKKYPRRLAYHILYGKCLTSQGRYALAKSEFEQVTRWAPHATESMEAWFGLAICTARLNETHADEYYQRYQELRVQLTALPERSGSFTDQARLRRARQATSEMLVMLAGVYSTNQLLQTDRLLRRALVINTHSDVARSMMSHLFEQQGLMEDAIHVLEEGCAGTPPSAICAVKLGQLCQRRGLQAEAEKGFLMAIAAEPRNAEYYAILAKFYLETKQKSNDAFLRAMAAADLDPSVEHYMLLAAAALANGDLSATKTAAQNALEIDPQNVECQKLLEQLVK